MYRVETEQTWRSVKSLLPVPFINNYLRLQLRILNFKLSKLILCIVFKLQKRLILAVNFLFHQDYLLRHLCDHILQVPVFLHHLFHHCTLLV